MLIDQSRVHRLQTLVSGLAENVRDKEANQTVSKVLYEKHKEDLLKVTPHEVLELFHQQLLSGRTVGDILSNLDKTFNVFFKGLQDYAWNRPARDSFMDVLMQENEALLERLDRIRSLLKGGPIEKNQLELANAVCELQQFSDHYLKLENILFPYLEKKMPRFDGLAIMWGLHDQTRASLTQVIDLLEENGDDADLKVAFGRLFFNMHGLAIKESLILFPVASEVIESDEWTEMARQSMAYAFPFIKRPDAPKGIGHINGRSADSMLFQTETGTLDFEQIQLIFDALPVDLSFVDASNQVRYFTRPKDRIFPRSPAVIGRDVKNCHPPESVGVVLEIIEAFRTGRKEAASFWIQLRGRLILIRYYAVRNVAGDYQGTLEVSQDVTEIQQLAGERRLLQWDSGKI